MNEVLDMLLESFYKIDLDDMSTFNRLEDVLSENDLNLTIELVRDELLRKFDSMRT